MRTKSKDNSFQLLVRRQMSTAIGNTVQRVSKHQDHNYHMIQQSFSRHRTNGIEISMTTSTSEQLCWHAALFTTIKIRKQSKHSSINQWFLEMLCIYTTNRKQFNFKQNKTDNSTICNNMDEPRGLYTKWSKLDTETQIYSMITLTCEI